MDKTKKIKIISITASVLLTIFVVTFCLCWFLLDEIYAVDLDLIRNDENMIWHDEFNGNSINTNNWRIEPYLDEDNPNEIFTGTEKGTRIVRKGGYWSIDQCIVEPTKDGATTANVLKIRTEKVGDSWHTAGIISDQALVQKYGYFEIRARLPKQYGTWSAFWMMPWNAPEPPNEKALRNARIYGGELDIMEAPAFACKKNQIVQQALHIGGYGKTHSSVFNLDWTTNDVGDIYDNFHTYGFYWDENMYKFYVDDEVVWTTSYQRTGNISEIASFLFLSTEIGGANGVVGENPWTFILPKDKQLVTDNPPEYMVGDFEIDYVRCYKIASTETPVLKQN